MVKKILPKMTYEPRKNIIELRFIFPERPWEHTFIVDEETSLLEVIDIISQDLCLPQNKLLFYLDSGNKLFDTKNMAESSLKCKDIYLKGLNIGWMSEESVKIIIKPDTEPISPKKLDEQAKTLYIPNPVLPDPDLIKITVEISNGKSFNLEIHRHDSIQKLKERILYKEGIPCSLQTLMFEGEKMEESSTFPFSNLSNNCRLSLEIMPETTSSNDLIDTLYYTQKNLNTSFEDRQKLLYSAHKYLIPTEEERHQSEKKIQELEEKSQKSGELDKIHALSVILKDVGFDPVLIEGNNTNKASLGMHLLFSDDIKAKTYDFRIEFDKLNNIDVKDRLENGTDQEKEKLLKKLISSQSEGKLKEDDVVILDMRAGSLCVRAAAKTDIQDSCKRAFYEDLEIQKVPLFVTLQLSPDLFNSSFDFPYPSDYKSPIADEIKETTGYDFLPPNNWEAFGIKVPNPGDWLTKPTWATAYHCVRSPTQSCEKGTVAESITENGLIAGAAQAYENDDSVTGGKVGRGVYLSPKIAEAEIYAHEFEINSQKYKLGFMCRVNPEALRIPVTHEDYWVVQEGENIRPYKMIIKKVEN